MFVGLMISYLPITKTHTESVGLGLPEKSREFNPYKRINSLEG